MRTWSSVQKCFADIGSFSTRLAYTLSTYLLYTTLYRQNNYFKITVIEFGTGVPGKNIIGFC